VAGYWPCILHVSWGVLYSWPTLKDVSTKGEQALSEEEPSGEGRQREEESKRARIRRRNVCLSGPEWAV
jgi:hypothetical protein